MATRAVNIAPSFSTHGSSTTRARAVGSPLWGHGSLTLKTWILLNPWRFLINGINHNTRDTSASPFRGRSVTLELPQTRMTDSSATPSSKPPITSVSHKTTSLRSSVWPQSTLEEVSLISVEISLANPWVTSRVSSLILKISWRYLRDRNSSLLSKNFERLRKARFAF